MGASALDVNVSAHYTVELTFDGGVHGQHHHGRYRFFTEGDVRLVHGHYEVYRNATSNRAEYLALQGALRALEAVLAEQGVNATQTVDLHIFSDSQLVVHQLKGEWAVEDPKLRALHQQVLVRLVRLGNWQIGWVPRRTINERLASVPAHKPVKQQAMSDPSPKIDAAKRRAQVHDQKHFKLGAKSAHSPTERVALQGKLERVRLDAAAAKRAQTVAAAKHGTDAETLTAATAQADVYLARIPNTIYTREALITRFIEIEHKPKDQTVGAGVAAVSGQAQAEQGQETRSVAHPDLSHKPEYIAIVQQVDAYLAQSKHSTLSRIELIEAQWKLHLQRAAIEQKQPWRSIRRADGSAVFTRVENGVKQVMEPEQMFAPGPSVRCFPDMAMAALREEKSCEFRMWLLARHLDQAGTGELRYAELRDFLCDQRDVFTVRRFQQIIRKGEGEFWVKHVRYGADPDSGRIHKETWLRLIGQEGVAELFALKPLRIHCVRIHIDDLLQGMGDVNASLFTSFHAGRGEREKSNGPISRATLTDLSGKSASAQRNYDEAMGTAARANYVRTGISASTAGPNELAHAALRHEGAAFVVNDALFRLRPASTHPIFGHGAIAVRLPNSYRADTMRFEHASAGRKRRINQHLHVHLYAQLHQQQANHLVDTGGRGNNSVLLQRRYFESRPQAQKAWDKRYKQALQNEARAEWAHPDAARVLRQEARALMQATYVMKQVAQDGQTSTWNRVGAGFVEEVRGLSFMR